MLTVILVAIIAFLIIQRSGNYGNIDRRLGSLEEQLPDLRESIHKLEQKIKQPLPAQTEKQPPSYAKEAIAPAPAEKTEPCPQEVPDIQPSSLIPQVPAIEPQQSAPFPAEALDQQAAPPAPAATETAPLDWERFSGVKLAAWVGGVTLFLGSAFFVKYSIEEGLISPLTRIIMGFITGAGLIMAGVLMENKKYGELRKTLAASGVAVLYAVIFAARTYYDFIGTPAAFILMSLTTAAGCLVAARLEGKYIAVLAALGGFLTPVLLSTGENRPIALFSYVALLDIGLLHLAREMEWGEIYALSATGTALLVTGWHMKFFSAEQASTSSGILFLFTVLFGISLWMAQEQEHSGKKQRVSVFGMLSLFAFIAASCVNTHGASPWEGLTALFLINAAQAAFVINWNEGRKLFSLTGIITYICLISWTSSLTVANLPGALICFIIFAGLHAALPLVLAKVRPEIKPPFLSVIMPLLSIGLVGVYLTQSHQASFMLWPAMLTIDFIALLIAAALGMLFLAVLPLLVTGAVLILWLSCVTSTDSLPFVLILLLFAAAFFAAGIYFLKKGFFSSGTKPSEKISGADMNFPPELFPALSAALPYILLASAATMMKPDAPGYIFGGALVLSGMLWLLVREYKVKAAGFAATLGSFIVLACWHQAVFTPPAAGEALYWYSTFLILLSIPPFLMKDRLLDDTSSWAGAAFAGPFTYTLVQDTVEQAGWSAYAGLAPAAFALWEIFLLLRVFPLAKLEDQKQKTRVALFGSMALLFISLIFPVQFDKEWITLAWALEGFALVWLYRRIEHEGLKYWALALFGLAFARLAINPAVLAYHPRQTVPVFNWFFYTYAIAAAAFFAGAQLWRPTDEKIKDFYPAALLRGLGTALLFLLVNIEIADYFSTGTNITFQFSGSFALDMSYTLAWGIFAMILLLAGIRINSATARGCSLALFAVTVLKLFFHDLWQLGLPYRAAAFISLALLLIGVSYFYQRYLSGKGDKQS